MPPPALGDWVRRIDRSFIDPLGQTSIESMAVGPGGLVASGRGPGGGAIWRSADGVAWDRIPIKRGSTGPLHVVADLDGYIAFDRTSVLVSRDGVSWSKPVVLSNREDVGLSAILLDGQRLIAFAGAYADVTSPRPEWVSKDRGATWAAVSANFASGDQVLAAARLPNGSLLAVGAATTTPAWISNDGHTWSRLGDEFSLPAESEYSVEEARWDAIAIDGVGRVVVVGTDGDIPLAVASADGVHWTRVSMPVDGDRQFLSATGVTATDAGFIATGPGGNRLAAMWRSIDGLAWELEPNDDAFWRYTEGARVTSAAKVGGRIVVGGVFPRVESIGSAAATWVTPSTGVTTFRESRRCPSTVSFVSIANTIPTRRANCFGSRLITITGYLAEFFDCDCDLTAVFPMSPLRGPFYVRMDIYPDTAHDGKLRHWYRLVGHRFRITGRFDDPSARGCNAGDVAPTVTNAVRVCRNRFVALEIRDLGKH